MDKFTKKEILTSVVEWIGDTAPSTTIATLPGKKEDSPARPLTLADVLAYCENELVLLDRKNGSAKKPTATQQANEVLKADVVAYLAEHPGEKFTCSGLIKSCPACADLSGPKVSALLTALCKSGLVVRTMEKRIPYFSIA